MYIYIISTSFWRNEIMTRASISLTVPNDKWIQSQIKSEEFSSRSEVVNDLVRQARKEQDELYAIRAALIEGEQSGMSNRTPEDIMKNVIERKKRNGTL